MKNTTMKNQITVTPEEAKKSAVRYDRLLKLTLKITGLDSLPSEFQPQQTPWNALVSTWDRYHEVMQCKDVIYTVLHHTKWLVYPTEGALHKENPHREDMADLLSLFEEELCNPGSGLAEVMTIERYKYRFFEVESSNKARIKRPLKSVSDCHLRFLKERFISLARPFSNTTQEEKSCSIFKEVVNLILPLTSTWNEQQWCNEKYILTQIDRTFNTHYAQTPSDLDCLVKLAVVAKMGSIDSRIAPINIQELPLTLIQQLWPTGTEDIIMDLYHETYLHAQVNECNTNSHKNGNLDPDEFGFAELKKSGIQKLAEELAYSKKISSKQLRTEIFNVVTQH